LSDILNHQAVAVLAKWSQTNNCKLLHISTDYVLITTYCIDGDCCKNPINVYGVTKLAGEKA
jgi:dTDP-4-dehydrorhamnose reductase